MHADFTAPYRSIHHFILSVLHFSRNPSIRHWILFVVHFQRRSSPQHRPFSLRRSNLLFLLEDAESGIVDVPMLLWNALCGEQSVCVDEPGGLGCTVHVTVFGVFRDSVEGGIVLLSVSSRVVGVPRLVVVKSNGSVLKEGGLLNGDLLKGGQLKGGSLRKGGLAVLNGSLMGLLKLMSSLMRGDVMVLKDSLMGLLHLEGSLLNLKSNLLNLKSNLLNLKSSLLKWKGNVRKVVVKRGRGVELLTRSMMMVTSLRPRRQCTRRDVVLLRRSMIMLTTPRQRTHFTNLSRIQQPQCLQPYTLEALEKILPSAPSDVQHHVRETQSLEVGKEVDDALEVGR
jgi:hypothetical protein